ncbi:11307_t:CDS:2 [Paraglomus occultum]|uniref:11307_t:CDS:1 n=1 Tax=Paraglomus occultum TaxID=144539 RepID=A0A9N8VY34_9GLOM|nr:11307_t:CDS:2 [Paraglomus occultum]
MKANNDKIKKLLYHCLNENKSQFTVTFFGEIEKAGKEAKDGIGEPTDRTGNSEFKDRVKPIT